MGARGGRPPAEVIAKEKGKDGGAAGEGASRQTNISWAPSPGFALRADPPDPHQSQPVCAKSQRGSGVGTIYLLPFRVPAVELLRFSLALNNGVSCLQVRGVCHEGKGDVPVGDAVDPPVVHPQVVLHVTGALGEGEESHCHATGAARAWGRVALTPGAAKRGLLAARNHVCCPPAAGSRHWQKAAGSRSWPGTHHSSSLM